MLKQYLEAGKVVGTHGLRGELRVEPWCDSAAFLCGLKTLYWHEGEQAVKVHSARVHKNIALLLLDGIDSVEKADALRGKLMYLNRADCHLEENRYFIQDMIDMEVSDADNGRVYGKLTDVLKTGANDVYQITDADGKEFLIPVIPDVIIHTDIQAGKLLIRPLGGIFDDAD